MKNNIDKIQNNLEALQVLDLIIENINTCCAITMEPDEVLELCDKIKHYLKSNDKL